MILVQDWRRWKAWRMTSNSRIQFNVKVSIKCSGAVWVMIVFCSKGWKDKEELFRIYDEDTQEVGDSSSCKSSSSTSLPASPLLPFLREKEKQRESLNHCLSIWSLLWFNSWSWKPHFWPSIIYKSSVQSCSWRATALQRLTGIPIKHNWTKVIKLFRIIGIF